MEYLFTSYQDGTLESKINQMDTKELTKSFKRHGFGNPSKNREKLLEQFKSAMEKAMNKGNAFMR